MMVSTGLWSVTERQAEQADKSKKQWRYNTSKVIQNRNMALTIEI